jgi:hypothetical protein
MGRFLRVLTVLNLILVVGALVLGVLLFQKRFSLKGRVDLFERYLYSLAETIEADTATAPEVAPDYEAMDTDECRASPLPEPQRSAFWSSYHVELETKELAMMDITSLERDLMSLYQMNLIDNRRVKDDISGAPITDGENTTQGVLKQVLKGAERQYTLLLDTRDQLVAIREELQRTIKELNLRKTTLREKMVTITELNAKKRALQTTIGDLEMKIADLKSTIRTLESEISDLQQEGNVRQEEIDTLTFKNQQLGEKVKLLEVFIAENSSQGNEGEGIEEVRVLPANKLSYELGKKGLIEAVDESKGFVVMRMSPEFLEATRNQTAQGESLPKINFEIQRADGTFVGKLKITKLQTATRIAIGEILSEWQQLPIKVGDHVVFE